MISKSPHPDITVPESRWILQGLERLLKWARMGLKTAKSRSLVLKGCRVSDKFHFSLDGMKIPSISEKPAKDLGKLFNHSLSNVVATQRSVKELETLDWTAYESQIWALSIWHPASDPLALAGL